MWGKNDPFFLPAGVAAFKPVDPDAEIHLLDAGHFALESQGPKIAAIMRDASPASCRQSPVRADAPGRQSGLLMRWAYNSAGSSVPAPRTAASAS